MGEADYISLAHAFLQRTCDVAEGSQTAEKPRAWASVLPDFKDTCKLKVVLATVPDPIHTHLALFFDRSIDAIQEAAQDSGYVFDEALMPWQLPPHAESTDYEIRLGERDYASEREKYPGLMSFHNKDGARLLVIVSGEAPTSGIHDVQFYNARMLAYQILSKQTQSQELKVLGPTFSGSLATFSSLLSRKFPPSVDPAAKVSTVLALSGTISSYKAQDTFFHCEQKPPPTLYFASVQENDDALTDAFKTFLLRRHYGLDRIAILSEDETAYGNIEAAGSAVEGVKLYFPREISQFRSAYQQEHDTIDVRRPESPVPRLTLQLDLHATGSDDDSVPPYSGHQLALSQEAVLRGIVSALRFHHIQYVIIRATDPFDSLFLTHYLRQMYPQGRVVDIGGDLLLERETEDSRLRGTLSLSAYPLRAGVTEHVFPSSFSVGTYNAMRILLAARLPDGDVKPQFGTEPLQLKMPAHDIATLYSWPASEGETEKSAQIDMLGRGGFWPVETVAVPIAPATACPAPLGYSRTCTPSTLPRLTRTKDTPSPPCSEATQLPYGSGPRDQQDHSFLTLSWRIYGVAIAVCFSLYLFAICRTKLYSNSSWVTQFAPKQSNRDVFLPIAVLSSVLLAAGLIFIWGLMWSPPSPPLRLMHFASVVTAIFFLLVIVELFTRGRKFLPFLWAVVSGLLAFFFLQTRGSNESAWRAVNLASGVSPLLPVIALLCCWAWWAWYTVAGCVFLDKRMPILPPDAVGGAQIRTRAITSVHNRKLDSILRPFDRDGRLAGVILLLVIVACALWSSSGPHPLMSIESRDYDSVFGAAVAITIVAVLATAFRLLLVWTELQGLLLALDSTRLRRGFSRVKGFAWKPVWRLGSSSFGDLTRIFTREVEALEVLAAYLDGTKPKGHQEFLQAFGKFRQIRERLRAFLATGGKLERDSSNPCAEGNEIAGMAEQASQRSLYERLSAWCEKEKRRVAGEQIVLKIFHDLQAALSLLAHWALLHLQDEWDREDKPIIDKNNEDDKACCGCLKPDPPETLTTRLEHFVCLGYVMYLLCVITRIRSIIMSIAGSYIFLVLALTLYPFEPVVGIRTLLIVLLVLLMLVVGVVLAQMHRDTILSRLTDTKPGELGVDFWLKLVSFGALPVLTFLASQYPEVSNFLFSWIQPSLNAVK